MKLEIACSLNYASGPGPSGAHALFYRYDAEAGFGPDRGESWVACYTEGRVDLLYGKAGWLTRLWRSETAGVFVTDIARRVYHNPDPRPRAAPWRHFDLPGTLEGVWGLDERDVFVWGREGGQPLLFRGDGAGFSPMPPPPHCVVGMHGLSPDLLFAVGDHGMLARWDGARWTSLDTGTERVLSSVFVASPEEIYACGHGRELFQGSVHGVQKVLTHSHPLRSICKWQGQVWVAAGGDPGLCLLEGGALVSKKDNLKATHLEAGERLLISCPHLIANTEDGATFKGSFIESAAALREGEPPLWR